jgi:hypothetical protein
VRRWIAGMVAVSVAACGGGEQMPDDLRSDLEMASSVSALELAPSGPDSRSVVSAVEQTAPKTRAPAPSTRAPRPRPAPAPPVYAAPQAEQIEEIEYAAAEPEPQPTEDRGFDGMGEEAVLTGRPQVVDAGPGPSARSGGGSDVGTILAGIGIAVIRGGVVRGDVHCPPPGRRGRNGGIIILPNRSAGGGMIGGTTVRGITIR